MLSYHWWNRFLNLY